MSVSVDTLIDCLQPLYLSHAKENASKASTKHAEVVGGGVSERSEQEQIERL